MDGQSGDSQISVVVLTHNRRSELARTLGHLSSLPERHPIIVVDNGSSDDTVAYVSRHYPEVLLVKADRNLGAAGRNLGVAKASTPYVAFCDDDTWWRSGSLRLAKKILDDYPDIWVLNAQVLVGPTNQVDDASLTMAKSPLEGVAGIGPALIGFMAGAVVMQRQAFLRHKGYDGRFFIGGEESLLAWDILNSGGRIIYAADLGVHHWPSSVRDTGLRRRTLARNAIWTAWLRLPAPLAWRRTLCTLRQLPDASRRRGALLDALVGLPNIVQDRRVLKRNVCDMLERVWRFEKTG